MLSLYVILVVVVALTDKKDENEKEATNEFKTIMKSEIILFSEVQQPHVNKLKLMM